MRQVRVIRATRWARWACGKVGKGHCIHGKRGASAHALRVIGGYSRRRLPLGGEGAAEPGAELDDGVPFSAQTSTCGSAPSRATSPLLEPVSTHVTPLKPRARAAAASRRELGAEQVYERRVQLVEEESAVIGGLPGDGGSARSRARALLDDHLRAAGLQPSADDEVGGRAPSRDRVIVRRRRRSACPARAWPPRLRCAASAAKARPPDLRRCCAERVPSSPDGTRAASKALPGGGSRRRRKRARRQAAPPIVSDRASAMSVARARPSSAEAGLEGRLAGRRR